MFNGKRVLITGGTGSLGHALARRILGAKEIIVFSRSEKGQIEMRNEFPDLKYVLGDIRDYHAVRESVRGVDIVIHAAAFKFLDLSEIQPRECVLTNVMGSLNIIQACKDEGIKNVVGISTDKSPYARNVYGCTKQIMEKMFNEVGYIWVRYGNVLGTTGSVVPKWRRLVELRQDLVVTDKKMRRFFFTLDEAVDLIFQALELGENRWAYMRVAKLWDLAEVIADGKVKVVEGQIRPGEKLDEVLVADYEGDQYDTSNAPLMSKEEIKEILWKSYQQ